MEENKFDVNLARMNGVLDNKTLRYRINGFAYACGIENVEIPSSYSMDSGKVLSNNIGVIFNSNKKKELHGQPHYYISVMENSSPISKCVTLNGEYGSLTFDFTNYYQKDKLDKKIVDIPFSISLNKVINKDTYRFDIETVDGIRTKFKIGKFHHFNDHTLHDEVVFYANVMDFSTVLKLIKSFANNPVLVFDTYNEIRNNKELLFTCGNVNKAICEDTNLDKPVGKIKKIVKTILKNK